MGADLLDLPEVAAACAAASAACGIDVPVLLASENPDDINDPFNSQVATVAVSVGVARELMARGARPTAVVGFSLGQISALAVAGVLSLEDTFALLNVRAKALSEACAGQNGGMLAVLGATHEDAQALCDECAGDDMLLPVNFNCPGQVVLSGDVPAIERAEAAWREKGKRSSRLKTAGAFHTPRMQAAADAVREFCATLEFATPAVPLICNTDAAPFVAEEAADRLARQIVSPVLFEQSIAALVEKGERTYIETGYGKVLTGLVKRIDKETERVCAGTREQFDEFAGTLA